MPDITRKLRVVIDAQDKASAKLKKFSGALKLAGLAVVAFAVGIGVKAVKAAAEFEKGMTNVATLVDTSTESMSAMGKKVREISKKVPVDIKDLTAALYNVRSAGISAADAMDVLETSGKLAVAGLATTEEAVDLLTSAINVYGDESHNASKLADILFKTVKAGKTTVAELAQGFGKVAAIAKETGISIEDLSAATAVLTTTGIKAAEAQTALKAMISNVLKPTKDATDAAERLGISFNLAGLEANGLSGMLVEIAEKAGDDKQALADLFGSVEAANAIFALTAEDGGAAMRDILESMTDGSIALDEAFRKQNATTAAQYQLLKNNLNVVLIELGTVILPVLIKAMDKALGFMKGWQEYFMGIALYTLEAEAAIRKFINTAKKVGGIITGGWRGGGNIPGVPFFQEGGVMPQTGLAYLHKGETVVPENKSVGNITVNINGGNYLSEDAAEQMGDLIIERLKLQVKL